MKITTPIEAVAPMKWQDLQSQTARILNEAGLKAEENRKTQGARGAVAIDVWARNERAVPPITYLCECKQWRRKVTRGVVQDFRSVMNDIGANVGFIISSRGFQPGANRAAEFTNTLLVTWEEFQAYFVEAWLIRALWRLRRESDPLIEYTEPVNSRVARKTGQLSTSKRAGLVALRKKYSCQWLAVARLGGRTLARSEILRLPLRGSPYAGNLPAQVLDEVAYRPFFEAVSDFCREGIAEFDSVFGERA